MDAHHALFGPADVAALKALDAECGAFVEQEGGGDFGDLPVAEHALVEHHLAVVSCLFTQLACQLIDIHCRLLLK